MADKGATNCTSCGGVVAVGKLLKMAVAVEAITRNGPPPIALTAITLGTGGTGGGDGPGGEGPGGEGPGGDGPGPSDSEDDEEEEEEEEEDEE